MDADIDKAAEVNLQRNLQQVPGRDHLTDLPVETLIKIFSHLPPGQYLAISHVSTRIRSVMRLNASTLCNEAIRLQFSLAAAFLELKLVGRWLIPSCSRFLEIEKDTMALNGSRYPHPHPASLRMINPGPQILLLAEKLDFELEYSTKFYAGSGITLLEWLLKVYESRMTRIMFDFFMKFSKGIEHEKGLVWYVGAPVKKPDGCERCGVHLQSCFAEGFVAQNQLS